ncbi:MAG TPA: glycosyl hydrolase family 18 protein, partial [Chitinophagaceae bacterium]
AYYSGNANEIDSFEVEKLSHIIFSFCHLKGNRLSVDNARDTATIHKLVSLKKRNPSLKVQLSLGGWGGCEPCSPIFVVDSARKIFAASVKELCDHFKTDGIDLDWEYPGIEGHPGHPFLKEDKANFTALVKELRNVLGQEKEISFAAGGFKEFFDGSIDWKEVMPLVDRVNLMSYDLVGGYNTMTGHHTALFSNAKQERSADHGIRYLDSLGVPLNKIVIGAAFYARTWENVPDADNGLYKPGKFKSFIAFNQFDKWLSSDSGFVFYLDTVAAAPYVYNASRKLFATFDDPVSIQKKTAYALDKGLNGIMFWELPLDKKTAGLLYQIDSTISARRK